MVEPEKASSESAGRLQRRQRRLLFWGVTTSIAGLTVTLLSGFIYHLMGGRPAAMEPTPVISLRSLILTGLAGTGALTLLVGAFLIGYWGLLKESVGRLLPSPTVRRSSVLAAKQRLERPPEPMPSITEPTTEGLDASEASVMARDTARQRE